jgi:hypothetical protein
MHNNNKWFTLIELILVIIIILILFVASKSLFQTPNKYLIDGEVCINTIHGKLNQFFYQGITGKDKTIGTTTYEPDQYTITITWWAYSKVWLVINSNTNPVIDSEIYISTTWSNIPSCNTNGYTVLLTGNDISPTGSSIYLNKNLNNSSWKPGMSICRWTNCTNIFTTKIDYIICKKTNNTIDTNSCKHTFSTRFDTATQSIKSNRCLNLHYDTQNCKKRSIDLADRNS